MTRRTLSRSATPEGIRRPGRQLGPSPPFWQIGHRLRIYVLGAKFVDGIEVEGAAGIIPINGRRHFSFASVGGAHFPRS